MRRLVLLGLSSCLSSGLGCGEIDVDSPFQNPVSEGSTGNPPAESSGGGDPSTSSGGPSTGEATEPDPDSSSGGGPAVCGDGVREGAELCDGEDFGDISCESEGYTAGTLVCGESCMTYATDGCYICGNGLLEVAEDCDGPLGPGVTCESAGFTEGTIACDMVTCLYDTSGCSLCGNGIVEGAEPCDADDVGGMSCTDVGFDGGMLACEVGACALDLSGCTGGMYIQDFEGGAIPAEFDSSGTAVWIADSSNPIAGSFSAANGDIGDSQNSILTLAVDYSIAGTVAFTHEEATEANYDYLRFWVDGAEQQSWSGTNAPQMASYPVAAGNHTFEWRYTKDGSVSTPLDRVWVDDIVLTGGVPTG
jgi:hypothetical protein